MKIAAGRIIVNETPRTMEERVIRLRHAGISEERIAELTGRIAAIEKAMEDPDYDDELL